MIREKHCVCRAPLSPSRLPPREAACHVTTRAHASPFSFSALSCCTHDFCLEGSLAVFSRIIGEKRLTPSSANEYARPCRLCSKQKEIQTGPDSGYPVSWNSFTSGLRGSFPSRVQSLGDSCSRTPSILPPCTSLCSSVPAYGVTHWASGLIPLGGLYPRPLQRHFLSLGLTDRFTQPR